jgi:hypothetical protein
MGVVTGGGGGGGSSLATESGSYFDSNPTTITNGGSAFLPFAAHGNGVAVLDITNPIHPLVKKAGLFVVTAEVLPTTVLTAGGSFGLVLTLDWSGDAIEITNGVAADIGVCDVSNSWVLAAGADFGLLCRNFDGAASRGFYINSVTVSRVGPA